MVRSPVAPRQGGYGRVLRIGIVVIAAALVAAAILVAVSWRTVSDQLAKRVAPISELDTPPPDIRAIGGGFNVLLVGSDTREGPNDIDGSAEGASLNDVNLLLHVAQDQRSAVVVSFPRDLEVAHPECARYFGRSGKLNEALQGGEFFDGNGLGCVVQTVSEFAGVPIQFAAMITFAGVADLATAIGGVDVCVTAAMVDADTGLDLPAAGTYTLSGWEALAFLRTRGGVGDGSDSGRVSSQQVYLSALVRKVESDGVLADPGGVLALAQRALQSMTVSASLGDVRTLASLALALRGIPLNRVTFVQYPSHGDPASGNSIPDSVAGGRLFDYIRSDQPFVLAGVGDDRGSTLDPRGALPPEQRAGLADDAGLPTLDGVTGQTAADFSCSVAR